HGIANLEACSWLAPDSRVGSAEHLAVAVARAVPWLAYHLPMDHPIRVHLPAVVELARQGLRDPEVWVSVGYVDEKKVDRIVTALGGHPTTGPEWIEVGPVRIEASDDWRTVQVRPASLSGLDDPALAVVRTRLEETENDFLAALSLLLGDL